MFHVKLQEIVTKDKEKKKKRKEKKRDESTLRTFR